jgi:hypothetical protein
VQVSVLGGGVRMPAPPVLKAPAPTPYVAPVYPRKQDRN